MGGPTQTIKNRIPEAYKTSRKQEKTFTNDEGKQGCVIEESAYIFINTATNGNLFYNINDLCLKSHQRLILYIKI